MDSVSGSQTATSSMQNPAGARRRAAAAAPALAGEVWTPALAGSPAESTATTAAWEAVLAHLQRQGASAPPIPFGTRLVESVLAAVGLVTLFPIMLAIALIIRLDSPGPVLFLQPRVGRHGRLFRFAKFRTLYADAKERWPHLYAYRYTPDEVRALHFKVPSDPRITRVGQWLRKSTLDELPNLWNVLTGEVALVGPRPEIPEMLPYYDAEGLQKFTVRPGITGLAQVCGRGELNFQDTVGYDVDYVRRRSVWLDLSILVRTVKSTVLRKGAF